jgi:hypothetical protein
MGKRMKRSFVLNQIEELLIRQNPYFPYSNYSEKAESILSMLEDLHMVAPDVCYNTEGEYDSKRHAAITHMHDRFHYWEDEDEA